MVRVKDIYACLNEYFPYSLAEKGDNSGLIATDGVQEVNKVLVSLDLTFQVIEEAVAGQYQLIVTHHPIVFDAIKAVSTGDYVGKKLFMLIRNNISAISCHTNLDIAERGINDRLAAALELKKVRGFLKTGSEAALFGQEKDSFLGRIGEIPQMPIEPFIQRMKERLGCRFVRYVNAGKPVHRVAVVGGSGASFFKDALKAGADTFVTADAKYSNFLPCKELGLNLIDAGHFYTENIMTQFLCELLKKEFPEVFFEASRVHRDIIELL